MHHVPRFFKISERMDRKRNPRKPKLERRNAVKHIDYDAASSSSSLEDSSSSSSPLITRSLDLTDRTSFRVEGNEGDFDRICRSLGLSGPEDFAIPAAAWEARRIRSSSDLLPRSRLNRLDSPISEEPKEEEEKEEDKEGQVANELSVRVSETVRIRDGNEAAAVAATELTRNESAESSQRCSMNVTSCSSGGGGGGGGIKGVRPPPVQKPPPSMGLPPRPSMTLPPPPAMNLPAIDHTCSTWDIFRDFAPESERGSHRRASSSSSDDGEEEEEEEEEEMRISDVAVVLSESCSFTTSNDDDSSSTTTDPSPNGRLRRVTIPWQKGELLGRGSFGSVYEGISCEGFFFAVKEVSLLDQGSQGKQSILQLEQEIALLSRFAHENIVQYLGTDKDESNLYIFLELVKVSLLQLYQKYILRDSQVSAYTRQILHGLKYLHDQNVVHRDIKCANILVDTSGSVKLADFGLAKATTLNDVKSCKGTAFWMAPEVVNGKNHGGYGLPADIWSLGCTVLEMLTRQLPYSDLECMQALYRIGKGVPPHVPDSLSKDARDFILRCLEVNPNGRPTAAELLDHPFVKGSLSTSSGSASPHIGRLS